MKILFYGDSITDAGRTRDLDVPNKGLGGGYVSYIANQLFEKSLTDYDIYNTGISGNRIVDLYARIKIDCWNIKPDLLSILIGINDIWHEVKRHNGVEIDRFEKVYRMLLEDTKKALPETKIMLLEPFVLKGSATEEEYAHQKCRDDSFHGFYHPLKYFSKNETAEAQGASTVHKYT